MLTKELCPSATVEASTLPYEDEDGWVDAPPPHLSDAEEDSVEMAVAERAAQIFEETGLYILCAILGPAPRSALKRRIRPANGLSRQQWGSCGFCSAG